MVFVQTFPFSNHAFYKEHCFAGIGRVSFRGGGCIVIKFHEARSEMTEAHKCDCIEVVRGITITPFLKPHPLASSLYIVYMWCLAFCAMYIERCVGDNDA